MAKPKAADPKNVKVVIWNVTGQGKWATRHPNATEIATLYVDRMMIVSHRPWLKGVPSGRAEETWRRVGVDNGEPRVASS